MRAQLQELYANGKMDEVMRLVLPTPDSSYDTLDDEDPLLPFVLNYLDASVFMTWQQALYAGDCLLMLLKQCAIASDKEKVHSQFSTRLTYELQLLRAFATGKAIPGAAFAEVLNSEQQGVLLSEAARGSIKALVPKGYEQLLDSQLAFSQGWLSYKQHKPMHAALLAQADATFTRPWQTFRYQLPVAVAAFDVQAKTPLLFLEPLETDFTALLLPLQQRPALFVFETRAKFLQMLQFPEVVQALALPQHVVYILELYPNSQFAAQAHSLLQVDAWQPFFCVKRAGLQAAQPLLQRLLQACLQQPAAAMQGDTSSGDWLYHVAKRLLVSSDEERLGIDRSMALQEYLNGKRWHDPHKGLPPAGKELGPVPIDYQKMKLRQLSAQRQRPHRRQAAKIKLVHVVPQIVDGGHAPSRLLANLLLHCDASAFEPSVISTERLQFHWLEYPYNIYCSASSSQRAPQRLSAFQKNGIAVRILDEPLSYEQTARQVVQCVQQAEADVVVFHGPDVINNMAAQMTDATVRVMFEHGTPPAYGGYDLVLASSEDVSKNNQQLFKQLKTDVQVLPFAVDVRSGWLAQPFPLEHFGVPAGSLLLTTISQHLDNRLSSEMCLAIAEILQRVPNAYYVPMGRIVDAAKFKSFFRLYQVDQRVMFMGPVNVPSQHARSMHLYLNEFPFGSCLGMLDAMACGCPVVTMYDPKGPPQARYGGDFMGIARAVTSGRRADYVELACRLLTDEQLYREWSDYTQAQYERHADVAGYVRAFEAHIKQAYYN